ncbi:MAG TPA: hypothetical protein VJR29_09355 [bacterium]|nr:hypothetical protein [bacterium]
MPDQHEALALAPADFLQKRLERAAGRQVLLDFQSPSVRQVLADELGGLDRAGERRAEQAVELQFEPMHAVNRGDHLQAAFLGQGALLFRVIALAPFGRDGMTQKIQFQGH